MRNYIGGRWSEWLRSSLNDASISPAALAREMLVTPDRNREPRAAVGAWLRGERVPTAETTFLVGQGLARVSIPDGDTYEPRPGGEPGLPSFAQRPPAPGGLMALHAAGYYGDAIDLAHVLLRSDDLIARRYAARLVAVVWIAHADLDKIDDEKLPAETRMFMRRYVGDAPIYALEDAWKRRSKVTSFGRALLAHIDLLDAEFDNAIHLGAVTAWRSLAGTVSLLAMKDDVLAEQWRYGKTGFEQYWEEVIRRQGDRSHSEFL